MATFQAVSGEDLGPPQEYIELKRSEGYQEAARILLANPRSIRHPGKEAVELGKILVEWGDYDTANQVLQLATAYVTEYSINWELRSGLGNCCTTGLIADACNTWRGRYGSGFETEDWRLLSSAVGSVLDRYLEDPFKQPYPKEWEALLKWAEGDDPDRAWRAVSNFISYLDVLSAESRRNVWRTPDRGLEAWRIASDLLARIPTSRLGPAGKRALEKEAIRIDSNLKFYQSLSEAQKEFGRGDWRSALNRYVDLVLRGNSKVRAFDIWEKYRQTVEYLAAKWDGQCTQLEDLGARVRNDRRNQSDHKSWRRLESKMYASAGACHLRQNDLQAADQVLSNSEVPPSEELVEARSHLRDCLSAGKLRVVLDAAVDAAIRNPTKANISSALAEIEGMSADFARLSIVGCRMRPVKSEDIKANLLTAFWSSYFTDKIDALGQFDDVSELETELRVEKRLETIMRDPAAEYDHSVFQTLGTEALDSVRKTLSQRLFEVRKKILLRLSFLAKDDVSAAERRFSEGEIPRRELKNVLRIYNKTGSVSFLSRTSREDVKLKREALQTIIDTDFQECTGFPSLCDALREYQNRGQQEELAREKEFARQIHVRQTMGDRRREIERQKELELKRQEELERQDIERQAVERQQAAERQGPLVHQQERKRNQELELREVIERQRDDKRQEVGRQQGAERQQATERQQEPEGERGARHVSNPGVANASMPPECGEDPILREVFARLQTGPYVSSQSERIQTAKTSSVVPDALLGTCRNEFMLLRAEFLFKIGRFYDARFAYSDVAMLNSTSGNLERICRRMRRNVVAITAISYSKFGGSKMRGRHLKKMYELCSFEKYHFGEPDEPGVVARHPWLIISYLYRQEALIANKNLKYIEWERDRMTSKQISTVAELLVGMTARKDGGVQAFDSFSFAETVEALDDSMSRGYRRSLEAFLEILVSSLPGKLSILETQIQQMQDIMTVEAQFLREFVK